MKAILIRVAELLMVTGLCALAITGWSKANAAPPNPLPWNSDYLAWTPQGCTFPAGGQTADCTKSFDIEYSDGCTGTYKPLVSAAPTLREYLRNNVPAGSNCYRMKASALDGGTDSAYSAPITAVTIPPVQPNPPIFTVDKVAYRMDLGNYNQIKVVAIGTVPLGKECVPQKILGVNIPVLKNRDWAVLPSGVARPKQVLVTCKAA